VLDTVARLVNSVLERKGTGQVAGVGIGTAGVVDGDGRIISATETFASWVGTDLVDGVRSRLRKGPEWPVAVINDVDAHALGELWLGAARGAESMLMVAAGTGVGGAVVVNGQLWQGAHHVAGEIGHIPAPGANGMRCPCGKDGHLEALASGPAIARRYEALSGTQVDAAEVAYLATAGDPIARDVVTAAAAGLGRAIAGIVTTIDPECVVVGGGVADAGPLWWQALRDTYQAELVDALTGVPLIRAELGTAAPLIGAALAAFAAVGFNPREKDERS
jgi:glucokinase